MARKFVNHDIWICKPHPQKSRVPKKNCQKLKEPSCSKLPEMARKLVEHDFWIFSAPPQKNGTFKIILSKIIKNLNCSKLPEMARKLVANDFSEIGFWETVILGKWGFGAFA